VGNPCFNERLSTWRSALELFTHLGCPLSYGIEGGVISLVANEGVAEVSKCARSAKACLRSQFPREVGLVNFHGFSRVSTTPQRSGVTG
jgi:hypothetical protein